MDDMRSEIRAAFEKEQAAHPPAVGLRQSVVASVARQPRAARNYEWLAVAAAVLLGILIVTGLVSVRFLQRGTPVGGCPASSPSGSASGSRCAGKPSPVSDYGPPPAGVDLLWVHDPVHPTWLVGYDWTGQPRATVKLDAAADVRMAPDGQSFAIGLDAKGGNWQFLDRLGRPIATPSTLPGAYSTLWADDNQHVCSMTFDQQTFGYTLWSALPGQPIKRVMVVARDTSIGQTGVSLAACSFKNDLAIAVRTTISFPSEMWVVRLSDGKILAHKAYAGGALANVIASADGSLTAENSISSIGQPAPGAAPTIIRRVSDGSVVASIDPTVAVLAFSGDDSLMLVTKVPWVGPLTHLSILELTGQQVWTDDGLTTWGGHVARPGGREFALAHMSPTATSPQPTTILIVNRDGTVIQFPDPYEPTW